MCLFIYLFPVCFRYVRIVGTHNTVNKVFHLVAFECMFTNRSFTLENGLVGKQQTADSLHCMCSLQCLCVDRKGFMFVI